MASSGPTHLLTPDALLKGRYRILKQLGAGGFGTVYQAQDVQFGSRLVAIKEMTQSGLKPEELQEATEAFQREAYRRGECGGVGARWAAHRLWRRR